MSKRDFYEVLGCQRGASIEEIKGAYRKLAKELHPDKNPGNADSEHHFKEINEAYDVLKDEQKRAAYDRFGHAAFEGGGPGAGGGAGAGFDGAGLGDIFDQMFGDFMGRKGGGGGSTRSGSDIRTQIEIDLTEAFAGTKATLRVPTRVTCETCNGSGSGDKDAGRDVCSGCNGAGKIRAQQGFFLVERTCPQCGGRGRMIRNPCRICHGTGTTQRERSLQVSIPAGVEDGTRIRLAGEGESGGAGVPAGDLYVHVSVRQHAIFQRDGANVFCVVPLKMTQAAMGGEIEVPVVDGSRVKVKIPAGTQSGDQQRLRGKGFSVLRSAARGDMYIQVKVEIPQTLTRRQRELLEAFEAEGNAKSNPETEGFLDRMKAFFDKGRG